MAVVRADLGHRGAVTEHDLQAVLRFPGALALDRDVDADGFGIRGAVDVCGTCGWPGPRADDRSWCRWTRWRAEDLLVVTLRGGDQAWDVGFGGFGQARP